MNSRQEVTPALPAADGPLNLVFFDERLRLRSEAAIPTQRIAQTLLQSPPERWPTAWDAWRSPALRLQRMVMGTLRAYASATHVAVDADEEEVWETLAGDLIWASQAASVTAHLTSLANALGLSSETDVNTVQQALAIEVLSVLHVRVFVGSAKDSRTVLRTRHGRWLADWRLTGEASEDLVQVYHLYLSSLMSHGAEPPSNAHASLQALAGADRLHTPAGLALSWHLTDVLAETSFKTISKDTPASQLSERLARAAVLAGAGVSTLPLHQIISFLHLALGAREMGSLPTVGAAAMHFARAMGYEPTSPDAGRLLQRVAQAPQEVRGQIQELQRQGRARPDADAILARMEGDVDAALHFSSSREAGQIRESHARALRDGLAFRLVKMSDEDRPALDALMAAVNSVAADGWTAGPEYSNAVKTRAEALEPSAIELPWDVITSVLQRVVLPAGELLPLLLSNPAPPSPDRLADALRSAAAEPALVSEATLYPRFLLRERIQRWFFSPRDVVFKVAGAAGVLLAAVTIALSATSWVHNFRLGLAFTRAAAAMEAGDDSRAVRSALTFLNLLSGSGDDPREAQLLAWLDQSMLREVVNLVEAGNTPGAERLLSRYAEEGGGADASARPVKE